MTRHLKFRLVLTIVAASVLCGTAAWADPPSQVGRLNLISGAVSFRPGSLDEWAPATLNYPMTAGDHLWTDTDARAEVHVRSAAIRLNSNTEFSFLNLDDEVVQARVSEGSLNVNLRSVDSGTTFEIDTPNATVSLPSAGSYRIDVQPSGETTVTVRAGRAEVTAGEYAYDVSAGQSTDISGSDSISYYVTPASRPDEWDTWSSSRDRREDQFASSPHVSRDMIGFEDLNENGTWLADAGDGPTWAPSHLPAGWAPYRFGHWSWVEPWGWTWIDDTAWGFAPFHYGRWAYRNARWVWNPGAVMARPVYAPALVVFVGGDGWRPSAGDGIGWFPLGPREIYVPPYTVSPEYVQRINVAHVTNINVQIIQNYNVTKVAYVNRTAPQAVTVVPREVFVQSRPAGRAVLSVSLTEVSRAPVMGMTAKIAPQRESIIAQPIAARAPVPQPPPELLTRRVESRIAPTPAQVPFVQQQKVLMANPGRPIEPVALTGMQRSQQIAPPAVRIVNPATLIRQKNPPVVPQRVNKPTPGVQQKPVTPAPVAQQPVIKPTPGVQQKPATPAPVVQPVIRPTPGVVQPVNKPTPGAQQKPVTPAPVVQPVIRPTPGVQQKPVTPAPVAQQPVIKPSPGVQQKPVTPAPVVQPVIRPTPGVVQPVNKPTPGAQQKPVTPAPVVQPVIRPTPGVVQPVDKRTPGAQQKPVTPAPVVQQPVIKPSPGVQQKPVTPAPVVQPVIRPTPGVVQPVNKPTPGAQQKPVTPAPGGQQPVKKPAPGSRGQQDPLIWPPVDNGQQ